jgi:D-serine deaminase-like pyridoxal phosphate-dependent protein
LPSVKRHAGLRVRALHAEHALIDLLDPAATVEAGDKIEIWVNHLDPTLQLHDRIWGVRNGEVESILTIVH